MAKSTKKPYEDKHVVPQFGYRMPADLREALEAQVEIYNGTREVGQPPRTLTTEINARLYASLGVDTAVANVTPSKSNGKAKRKGAARG